MGVSAIGSPWSTGAAYAQARQRMAEPPKAPETKPAHGWDVSVSPTFSAGRFDGEKTVLFGGRAEVGKEVFSHKLARVAIVGDLHAGIGNGLNSGFGIGARGELGSRNLNVYGAVGPQINMGISMNGLTAGAGIRAATGVQAGKFFAEVSRDIGSNMNMTSAAVGMRIRF